MTSKKYGSLDLTYLLLEHYKKLKISERELAVILMIDHLLEDGNKLITNNLLALKMNYTEDEIDDIIVSLLKKNLLEYKETSKGGLKSSLEPLNKILYKEFELSVLGSELNSEKLRHEQIKKLYKTFESTFGRSLAPVEIHRIDEWLGVDKYNFDEIEFALKEAKINNACSIQYIDKILYNKRKRDDILKEGYSFRDENRSIDENVDDVIEILKTKWTD